MVLGKTGWLNIHRNHWKTSITILIRSFSVACFVGAAFLGSSTVVSNPALAASCSSNPSRSNCDGQDPQQQGCNDAQTVATSYFYYAPPGFIGPPPIVGKVELRYSNRCRSNWSKVSRYDGRTGGFYTITADITRDSDGRKYTITSSGYTSIFSNMVFAPTETAYASGVICGLSSGAFTSACVPSRTISK